jgi:hypothetical protein
MQYYSKRYELMQFIRRTANLYRYIPGNEVEGIVARNYARGSLGNDGAISGPTLGVATKTGRAYSFDGANDVITLGTGDPSAGNMTISGILNWGGAPNTANTTQAIATKRNSFGAATMRFGFCLDKTNTYKYLVYGDGAAFPFWNKAPTANVPEYFAWVHDVTNSLERLYINGVQHSTVALVSFGSGTGTTLRIGAVGDGGGSEFLYGKLSHLAIHSSALSAATLRRMAHLAGFI